MNLNINITKNSLKIIKENKLKFKNIDKLNFNTYLIEKLFLKNKNFKIKNIFLNNYKHIKFYKILKMYLMEYIKIKNFYKILKNFNILKNLNINFFYLINNFKVIYNLLNCKHFLKILNETNLKNNQIKYKIIKLLIKLKNHKIVFIGNILKILKFKEIFLIEKNLNYKKKKYLTNKNIKLILKIKYGNINKFNSKLLLKKNNNKNYLIIIKNLFKFKKKIIKLIIMNYKINNILIKI